MTENSHPSKNEVRKAIRRLKGLAATEELECQSGSIYRQLQAHPRFQSARTVLLYASLPDEPNTHTWIRDWWEKKTLLLPVVCGDTLVLRKVTPETVMREGAFHISEPLGADFQDWAQIDLAVIPGVAFDDAGYRLGRGRGYYDRLLSAPALASVYKIGVCFDFQRCRALPVEPHDVPMNEVLSV